MMRRIAGGILAVGLAACGGTASTGTGATEAQLAAFQATGQGLANEIQSYSAKLSAPTAPEDCRAAHHQYDAAASPLVGHMQEQSHQMDGHMAGAGGHGMADMACTADAMGAELARHRAAACTSNDPVANQVEALHHAQTMSGWLEHQRVRYEDIAAMSGMMQAHSESTFACQANADGSFTFTQGGTSTHYPDPEHQSGSPSTPPTTSHPSDWPMPGHDSGGQPHSPGMH